MHRVRTSTLRRRPLLHSMVTFENLAGAVFGPPNISGNDDHSLGAGAAAL